MVRSHGLWFPQRPDFVVSIDTAGVWKTLLRSYCDKVLILPEKTVPQVSLKKLWYELGGARLGWIRSL